MLYIAIPDFNFRHFCILNILYRKLKILKEYMYFKPNTVDREIVIYKLTMLYYQTSYMDITST